MSRTRTHLRASVRRRRRGRRCRRRAGSRAWRAARAAGPGEMSRTRTHLRASVRRRRRPRRTAPACWAPSSTPASRSTTPRSPGTWRCRAPPARAAAHGAGVPAPTLDTGISFDHPAFAGHLALPGIEPGVADSPGSEGAGQVDTNGDGIQDGSLGQGTHVAGIVLAVAPQARLLPVRVLDSDGVGSAFDVAYGIVHAVERGAQVLNMSLGLSSPSSAVAAAIRFARDRGVVVVVPTGNDQIGSLSFPASMSEVVAVAGTDSLDQHAWFTNYGYGTDIAAPAMGILSTYYGGGYARWSGTSMAAPFVSGTAALLYGLMLPGDASTPGQVQSYLLQGAYSLYSIDPGFAWGLGAGRVDAARSVNAVSWGGDAVVEEKEGRASNRPRTS